MSSKTTFTDKKGNVWDLDLTIGTLRRLQSWEYADPRLNGISLTAPTKEILELLATDAGVLFQLVFSIIQPQTLEVYSGFEDPEVEFLANIGVDAIREAREALFEALSFFSPEAKILMAHRRRLQEGIEQAVRESLEKTMPKLMQTIDRQMTVNAAEMEKMLEEMSTASL